MTNSLVLEIESMPIMDHDPAESAPPPAALSFDNFGLSQDLLIALERLGLHTPTPIQAMAIPVLLQGRDLIGLAQTGTGKTAAFLLPILTMLGDRPATRAGQPPQALILAPTRELANQIRQNLQNLAQSLNIRHMAVFGGARYDIQIRGLRRGVDVVVATPGRLEDLMERGAFDPSGVTHFVLDEADHMLDLGFYPAIQRIAASLPHRRQTMLFSATMPPEIEKLANRFLNDPAHVKAPQTGVTADRVTQHVTLLSEGEKRDRLCDVMNGPDIDQVLIFVRTKRRADALAKFMQVRGFAVDALHGDMRQSIRQKVLQNFRSGALRAIIATDVAARGIDVAGLGHVVNFDLTDTPEAYIHRIGRTGRAGRDGIALSFCAPDEQHKLAAIIAHVGARVELFAPDGTSITDFVAARAPGRQRSRPPASARHGAAKGAAPNRPARPARMRPTPAGGAKTEIGDQPQAGLKRGAEPSRPFGSDRRGGKPAQRPSQPHIKGRADTRPQPKKPSDKPTSKGSDARNGSPSDARRTPRKTPFAAPPVFNSRPNFGDKPDRPKTAQFKPDKPRPNKTRSNPSGPAKSKPVRSRQAGFPAGGKGVAQTKGGTGVAKAHGKPPRGSAPGGRTSGRGGQPASGRPRRDGGQGRLKRR
jgi:ATP-dependent RNA helicase RhlE